MDLITRLISRWESHGINCPSGVSPAEIDEFEAKHNVILPSDMSAYFLKVNGTGDRSTYDDNVFGNYDDNFFAYWPLGELISIAEDMPDRSWRLSDASSYFQFADHSVCLPTYAIRLSASPSALNPVVSVFADSGRLEVEKSFGSFTDFVLRYLDDWGDVATSFPTSS